MNTLEGISKQFYTQWLLIKAPSSLSNTARRRNMSAPQTAAKNPRQ